MPVPKRFSLLYTIPSSVHVVFCHELGKTQGVVSRAVGVYSVIL